MSHRNICVARHQNHLYFFNPDVTPEKIDALVYPYDLQAETWGTSFVIKGPTSDNYGSMIRLSAITNQLVTPDGKYIFYIISGATQTLRTYEVRTGAQKSLLIAPSMCSVQLFLTYAVAANEQVFSLYVTDKYFIWVCPGAGPYEWRGVSHILDGID